MDQNWCKHKNMVGNNQNNFQLHMFTTVKILQKVFFLGGRLLFDSHGILCENCIIFFTSDKAKMKLITNNNMIYLTNSVIGSYVKIHRQKYYFLESDNLANIYTGQCRSIVPVINLLSVNLNEKIPLNLTVKMQVTKQSTIISTLT